MPSSHGTQARSAFGQGAHQPAAAGIFPEFQLSTVTFSRSSVRCFRSKKIGRYPMRLAPGLETAMHPPSFLIIAQRTRWNAPLTVKGICFDRCSNRQFTAPPGDVRKPRAIRSVTSTSARRRPLPPCSDDRESHCPASLPLVPPHSKSAFESPLNPHATVLSLPRLLGARGKVISKSRNAEPRSTGVCGDPYHAQSSDRQRSGFARRPAKRRPLMNQQACSSEVLNDNADRLHPFSQQLRTLLKTCTATPFPRYRASLILWQRIHMCRSSLVATDPANLSPLFASEKLDIRPSEPDLIAAGGTM